MKSDGGEEQTSAPDLHKHHPYIDLHVQLDIHVLLYTWECAHTYLGTYTCRDCKRVKFKMQYILTHVMVDLLILALQGILFMCLWGVTQCKKKTTMLIIVLSSEWQKPQAPGSGILSRNGTRESYLLRCAIYSHLEFKSSAK